MKRQHSSRFLFSLILIGTCFLTGAPGHTFAGEKWTFLTEEWKPFNFYSEDKAEVTGLTAEIVRTIARRLEMDVSISIKPWSRSYHTALNKENHAVFSMFRTPKREGLFKWVGPVYHIDAILWGIESRNLDIKTLEDAKKYRIIVQLDSAYEETLKARGFKKYDTNADRKDIYLVLKGRGDLVPISALGLEKLNKQAIEAGMPDVKWKPYAVLDSRPFYIGFNISAPDELVERWQAELDQIKSSDYYDELIARFVTPLLSK